MRERGNGIGGRLPCGGTSITPVGQVDRGKGRVKESSLILPTALEFLLTLISHPRSWPGLSNSAKGLRKMATAATRDGLWLGVMSGVRALESDRTNLESWLWSSITMYTASRLTVLSLNFLTCQMGHKLLPIELSGGVCEASGRMALTMVPNKGGEGLWRRGWAGRVKSQ